ncbi:hypothetical protein K432DRAFT_195806 [Lepidopterella palustris CBS 459.81]|uniref:F-box domain-containing protein n=1 Tax=Lepidopterella palustris CBS 459.81 TaxID=1314670 RepID=A0A8E2JHW8_9PEZI|nr:hypothetical protein K432DRAFT_195806 [Lepidopterella palustris CBS 459.81]
MASIISRLCRLPPELIEGILIELPTSAVIELSKSSPYVAECLRESPSWRHLFKSQESIEEIQQFFGVFLEFHNLICYKPFQHGLIHCHVDLQLSYRHTASRNWSRRLDPIADLYDDLKSFLRNVFSKVNIWTREQQLERIGQFSPTPLDWPYHYWYTTFNLRDPSRTDVDRMKQCITQFRTAEDSFNAFISSNLHALAKFLSACEAKMRGLSQSSPAPRKDILPIINYLFRETGESLKSRVLDPGGFARYFGDSAHSLALPYDQSLVLLLQVLTDHPLKRGVDNFSSLVDSTTSDQEKDQHNIALGGMDPVDWFVHLATDYDIFDLGSSNSSHDYPRHIAADMRIVFEELGLMKPIGPPAVDFVALLGISSTTFSQRAHETISAEDSGELPDEDEVSKQVDWLLSFLRTSEFCQSEFPEIVERLKIGNRYSVNV